MRRVICFSLLRKNIPAGQSNYLIASLDRHLLHFNRYGTRQHDARLISRAFSSPVRRRPAPSSDDRRPLYSRKGPVTIGPPFHSRKANRLHRATSQKPEAKKLLWRTSPGFGSATSLGRHGHPCCETITSRRWTSLRRRSGSNAFSVAKGVWVPRPPVLYV